MTCFPFASRRRGGIVRLLLAASAAVGVAAVRLPAQMPGDSAQRLPEDSAVRTGRLPNGLTYYIAYHAEPVHRAELRLVVNAGSVLEDERQRGLAHLLEHMAFDGSTHFPKHAVWDYLARVGLATGADVNAETSFDHTMYRLTIPTDTAAIVTNGLQILADWAHGLTLDSTELERERKVVIEEWRLHRGAGARIQESHLRVLLGGSRYAERQPIGLVSVLERASIADVRRFYRDWYRPDLMAVVIVGDLDPAEMETRVRALFGAIPAPRRPRPRPRMTVPVSATPLASAAADSEATATSISWLTLSPHRDVITVGDYRRSLVNSLAEAMLNARLSEAAREADAPFLGASVSSANIVRPVDAWELDARVVDGGAQRALTRLRAEVARVGRDGFLASELAREKTALLRRYDQVEAEREKIPSAQIAAQLVGEYLSGSPTPSTEYEVALARRLVPTITGDEVNRVFADVEAPRGRVVLASGPVSSASALPDTATLLAALAGPVAALPAYADSTANAPLIAHEPEPGKVIATARIDTLGLDIWTLSNGVRVILEPTTLDPGQVLITSYRDGGTSVAPDSELVPAATALDIVSRSGLGTYDAAALRKRLAGTVASVGGALGPYGEGVWGSGSPKDMATLFQLVYLQFTAPRLDSTAFEQYRAALRDALAHRAASPEAAMRDTLGLLLANHSPRARVLDTLYLRQMDAAKSLAFFKSRFADVTGFTFVIVGAFTPDSIKPLVERYLGGLPASGRPVIWRDTGVRPPAGITVRVIHKGREPKASTTLVFLGSADTTRAERLTLLAVSNVLQQRLWERLRQQLGGVYGVSVSAEQDAVPTPHYRIFVGFGADPARIDELVNAVFNEIDSLAAAGPTAEELEKFKEEQRRGRETAVRTNQYWLQAIALYDQRGWPLPEILDADRRAESITAQQIQAAARRYFDASHYVQVTLLPEEPTT